MGLSTNGFVNNTRKALNKNAPNILTVFSVLGLAGTVASAIAATPKACEIMYELDFGATKVEIVKATWKVYLPTILIGGATIACIIGNNTVNSKRNAALSGAYLLSERALTTYQEKIVEKFGEKKAVQVKDEIKQDAVNAINKEDVKIIVTGNGEMLCLDINSGRYFRSSIERINRTVNEINRDLLQVMWISLNDIYGALGLAPIAAGDSLGWDVNSEGMFEIDFSTCLAGDEPCITLSFDVKPEVR